MVLPLPGRPMMRLMALAGSPPPRTASSGSWPLSSRSLMKDLLAGAQQERARSQEISDCGHELQRFQRFHQERIGSRVHCLVPALQDRYRDDRHVVVLLESAAKTETGAARYQDLDHR